MALLAIAAAGWSLNYGCTGDRRTTNAREEGGAQVTGDDGSAARSENGAEMPAKLPRKEPETAKQREIRQRLQRITCPLILFENASPDEAVDFFRLMRFESDLPGHSKLPLIVRHLREGEQVPAGMEEVDVPLRGRLIKELKLRNVPVWDAIHLVAKEADLLLTLTDEGLVISPK